MVNTRWVPPGKQTFVDDAGNPLVGGKVWTFIPNTSTPKTTWVDQARTGMNDNPLTLDARGQCTIWGEGLYSQRYTDAAATQIWNQITGFVELEVATPAETAAGIRNDVYVSPYSLANASLFLPQIITPEQYGAIGNGVADDSDALEDFFAASATKVGVMVGRYKITRQLAINLISTRLIGVPGYTKILGSFGYTMIVFLALSNVEVEGIWFDNTYANVAFDSRGSICTNFNVTVLNSSFRRCRFTCPAANTRAFMVYGNTGGGALTYIDGLWVEDCDFEGVGDLACTIMNRSADPTKFRRVYFNRNRGLDLGLIGTDGFLISFDGCGQEWTCNDNVVENALGIGVEIAGVGAAAWSNGQVKGNRGSGFSRTWMLLGLDQGGGLALQGIDVSDNRTEEPASATSYFIGVENSNFSRNYLERAAGGAGAEFRKSSYNKVSRDTYISVGNLPLWVTGTGGASTGNIWDNCTFDNAAGAGFAGVRFDGATVTQNEVRNSVMNLTSAIADETNSAAGNIVHSISTPTDFRSTRFGAFTMPADANATVTGVRALVATDVVQVLSAVPLTATRDLTIPLDLFIEASKILWNATAQTLQLVGPGGVGDSIAAGVKRVTYYNENDQTFRVVV